MSIYIIISHKRVVARPSKYYMKSLLITDIQVCVYSTFIDDGLVVGLSF